MDIDREKQSDDRSFKEETAAEIAPRLRMNRNHDEDRMDIDDLTNLSVAEVQEGTGGSALGFMGLFFSFASLFFLPFLLSLIGIGAGFIAYRRGAKSTGRWAIGIGVVSLVGSMIFAPFLG